MTNFILISAMASIPSVMPMTQAKEACPMFHIGHQSVSAGSVITWNGETTRLLNSNKIELEKSLPTGVLVNLQMKDEEFKPNGKVRLISFVPSLDTPVCQSETQEISKTAKLKSIIERVTISMDLPYAQRRFAEEHKISNINFLSDYRTGHFAKAVGLQIERNGLFARSIVITDGSGVIRYVQTVPEITEMPDLQKAYEVANGLIHD